MVDNGTSSIPTFVHQFPTCARHLSPLTLPCYCGFVTMPFSLSAKWACCSMTVVTKIIVFALLVALGADAATYVIKASNGDKIQVRSMPLRNYNSIAIGMCYITPVPLVGMSWLQYRQIAAPVQLPPAGIRVVYCASVGSSAAYCMKHSPTPTPRSLDRL